MMKIETIKCDVCKKVIDEYIFLRDKEYQVNMQIIVIGEYSMERKDNIRYFEITTLDLCAECQSKAIKGNYIFEENDEYYF